MASDIWLRTILIVRKETRYRHIGYSYRLTARVLLYAPSHRQDSTYHGLCYTSRGALAGTRNSSMGPPNEGSIRRPTAPWANALPLSYVPLLVDDYLLVKFSVKMGNDEHRCWSFLVHEPDVDLAHFLWELLPALSRRLARQVFDVFKGRGEPPLDAAVGKIPTCWRCWLRWTRWLTWLLQRCCFQFRGHMLDGNYVSWR